MTETTSDGMTIEEMKAQVEAAEQAEAEAQAVVEAERLAPYNEFKESTELASVMQKLEDLRKQFVGEDEARFRKVDNAYRMLQQV